LFCKIGHLVVIVSVGKGLDQPACQEGWKMYREKRRIVMPMWSIYMCAHVSYSVVMLFTCTLARSHPDSRKALGVKPDPLRQTARYWAEHSNKMHAQRQRPGRDFVWSWTKAMKDIFTRCSKKIAVQVCIVIIVCSFSCNIICFHNMLSIHYVWGNWFIILIGVYFLRLKINHDSHEFILESSTVANSNARLE
jgi:hypothetical protein